MSEPFRLDDDAPARRLAYLGSLLLIAIPFLQAGQQLWPLQLGNIRWRYGAANALSGILLLPFLGLALAAFVARAADDRVVARVVGVAAGVFAAGLLGSAVLFALDAQQLKALITSQMMTAFTITTIRVLAVTVIFAGAFAVVMVTALTVRGRNHGAARRPNNRAVEGYGLVVARDHQDDSRSPGDA